MQEFKDKYITVKEAVKHIHDGDRVLIGHACGEPRALVEAFCDYGSHYKDVETIHMVGKGESRYCNEEFRGHIRHNSLFIGNKTERSAVLEGRADFTPVHFSETPSLFSEGIIPIDVAMIQVSRPDEHGYVSLGVSVDYTLAGCKCAKLKIAQINKNMPRTHGDCFMHLSEFDYLVEADTPLIELLSKELTDIEKAIGKNCAALVNDGDTLQLGIGSLPDAVLLSLRDKKDLGIHTEMFSDGVMELVESGVITNKRKTLLPGKMVATFLMGTKKLYDFVDDNPAVYMAPSDYTNNPCVIAQNDNLISINTCVSIDLSGQVCSEAVGTMQISGTGGQVDFARGANMSTGGKSIMALSSTAKNGTISKNVPEFESGAVVTTGRNEISYVVTEYGIACLRGKSLRLRSRELINIAHPDFRNELIKSWEDRFKMKW
ncbi:MAG: acetyl-CoA hydrolase/transferase family protein [Suipraeoptans sp.]